MKKCATLAALLLTIWGLIYAGFAFTMWVANPGQWSTDARYFFVCLCAVSSFVVIGFFAASRELIP